MTAAIIPVRVNKPISCRKLHRTEDSLYTLCGQDINQDLDIPIHYSLVQDQTDYSLCKAYWRRPRGLASVPAQAQ